MNEFDQSIQQARQKRFIQYSIVGSVVIVGLFTYLAWLFLAKGYVINVLPEEAQISARVDVREGQGLYIGGVLYLLSKQAVVNVSADEFEPETIRINAATASTLMVTLTPSPGTLVASTTPSHPETEWSINGELIHIGEGLEEHRLPPGEYALSIRHKYYQPIDTIITTQRAQSQQRNWPLTSVAGTLNLNTSPVSARVEINGEVVGVTPLTLGQPAGEYTINIAADGYESIDEQAEITYNQLEVKRQYQLVLRKGALSFNLSPVGGTLLIDDVAVNTNKQAEYIARVSAKKKHSIRYEIAGYSAYRRQVQVAPDENKKIPIRLEKTFGTVNITTSPAATISINGMVVGQSSFGKRLSTIPYKFTFSLDGYRTQTQTITPHTNSKKNIRIVLLSEFDARRKESKPLFVSTLGIKLQATRPDAFTMGSAPNEKGRQRNEFPLSADFTRSIWVSQHEITEAQYRAFDASKPNTTLPISNVSWVDAVRYSNWLSNKEGLPAFYKMSNGRVTGFNAQSTGYRLLSESEWEWLAKKAKRSVSTVYIWGNSERIPKRAGNIADKTLSSSATFYIRDYDDGVSGKAPVGSFKADRAGLYDLMGNVSEWVHDNYTNTPPSKTRVVDYMGASRGVGHIVKGANYNSGRFAELRGAYKTVSETSDPTIGFRISRYAQ
ncbi:MAG: sulfatase activating formylglycine-generating enzyme [Granulosicoccus sp.]|jgi:formylglycine-generating enzyme required for sulfatase activity